MRTFTYLYLIVATGGISFTAEINPNQCSVVLQAVFVIVQVGRLRIYSGVFFILYPQNVSPGSPSISTTRIVSPECRPIPAVTASVSEIGTKLKVNFPLRHNGSLKWITRRISLLERIISCGVLSGSGFII
jgi:hypothetical protein